MQHKILIVDDDSDLITLLGGTLRRDGYEIIVATDGSTALTKALTESPSLVVLDVALPVMSGFEVCRQLKTVPATRSLPIIMLTGRTSEQDRVRGLEVGADDYVTKPFSLREFVLRIRRSIGRNRSIVPVKKVLRSGTFVLDQLRHEVRVHDEVVHLTSLEFKFVALLMEHPGVVLERAQLLEAVWGYGRNVSSRTVDTHVMRLRAKLGRAGALIETVHGVGYRMREEEDAHSRFEHEVSEGNRLVLVSAA